MQKGPRRPRIRAQKREGAESGGGFTLFDIGEGRGRKAGRKHARNREDFQGHAGKLRAAMISVATQKITGCVPDELDADDKEDENNAEDLAALAARQPAFEPGENRAIEENIERPKARENERGPGEKHRSRHTDSNGHTDEPRGADDAGGIERAIGETNQEIRPIAEGKAQEIRGVEIFGERRGHHREKLPIEKQKPERKGDPSERVV